MHRLTKASLGWPRLTVPLAVILAALGLWSFLRTPLSKGADASIGADQPELRETVGRGVATISLALELDFLRMLASNFPTLAHARWRSAAAISALLVTELIALPPLLAVASRNRVQAGVPKCTG